MSRFITQKRAREFLPGAEWPNRKSRLKPRDQAVRPISDEIIERVTKAIIEEQGKVSPKYNSRKRRKCVSLHVEVVVPQELRKIPLGVAQTVKKKLKRGLKKDRWDNVYVDNLKYGPKPTPGTARIRVRLVKWFEANMKS